MMKRNPDKPAIRSTRRREHAFLMLELAAGMFILLVAVIPIAYSFSHEIRLFRTEYQHAVAMEIVDGEMETLVAGEWNKFPDGSQPYSVRANAATNLPPGHFQLTKTANRLRLEWQPDRRHGTPTVVRETTIK